VILNFPFFFKFQEYLKSFLSKLFLLLTQKKLEQCHKIISTIHSGFAALSNANGGKTLMCVTDGNKTVTEIFRMANTLRHFLQF
jgi:hypothetical protein